MKRRTLALALLLVPFAGCFGPTLPLPPPTALVSPPDAAGYVVVSGQAQPSAYVLVLNLRTDSGVIGRADEIGAYTVRLEAMSGDMLEVGQMAGSQHGAVRGVVVP